MCFDTLVVAYAFWGPLSGDGNTILWYADSKNRDVSYMPEMRLVLGLSAGLQALVIAYCEYFL
jgi:hypothetical protein